MYMQYMYMYTKGGGGRKTSAVGRTEKKTNYGKEGKLKKKVREAGTVEYSEYRKDGT